MITYNRKDILPKVKEEIAWRTKKKKRKHHGEFE